MGPLPRTLLALIAAASLASGCVTDDDCSLNGVCTVGTCRCAPAWGGDDCGVLQLLPTEVRNGLQQTKTSSWGGTVIQDPESGEWTLICAEFVHTCGLASWSPNSRVVRAISTSGSPLGPYKVVAEILPPFHHNPQVIKDPDGGWVMFSIGRRCNNTVTCHGFVPPPDKPACPIPNDPSPSNMESGIFAFSAPTLSGPWKQVSRDERPVLGGFESGGSAREAWDADTTNPSPLIFPDGSALLVYRGCPWNCQGAEKIGLAFSPTGWRGPFNKLTADTPLCNEPWCEAEDAFVWRDATTGHYHALLHSMASVDSEMRGKGGGYPCDEATGDNCSVGSHMFSRDGFSWTFSKTIAYNTTIEFRGGGREVLIRRERPQLLFDAQGAPMILVNGATHSTAANKGKVEDYSFTLMVPIQRGDHLNAVA